MKGFNDNLDHLEDKSFAKPLEPVISKARLLLRRFYVWHEMCYEGNDVLTVGLKRFLANIPPEYERIKAFDAIEQEVFGFSLLDLPEKDIAKYGLGRLVEFGRRVGLGPDQENLLCLLIASEINPEVLWTIRGLCKNSDMMGIETNFVRHLLDPRVERPLAIAQILHPEDPLFRFRIILTHEKEGRVSNIDYLRISKPALYYFLGGDLPLKQSFVSYFSEDKVKEYPSFVTELLYKDIVKNLYTILFEEKMLVVISAPRGAGVPFIARSLAQRAHIPMILVDLEGANTDEQMSQDLEKHILSAFTYASLCGGLLVILNGDIIANKTDLLVTLTYRPVCPLVMTVLPSALERMRGLLPKKNVYETSLTIPDVQKREVIWRTFLSQRSVDRADEIASLLKAYPIGPDHIADICSDILLDTQHQDVVEYLRGKARNATGHRLGSLAVRVHSTATWSQVVLPPKTLAVIEELLAYARHLHQVLDGWGFGRHLNQSKAISALFSGPPGTGKTLVAGLIAKELNLELYRVDLARIVSKYIGETEERLARLFDEASVGGVCLLFDEADALFSRRTEVRTSVDRYANLEVDYLLQKMDEFDGVVILTTNFPQSIDDAFLRRLKFRVQFTKPDVTERERLWKTMLSPDAPISDDISFSSLAEAFDFTGAEIRNSVLRAAFLAASSKSSITMEILKKAAIIECEQSGKLVLNRDIW